MQAELYQEKNPTKTEKPFTCCAISYKIAEDTKGGF
jgi:hypothetical protein